MPDQGLILLFLFFAAIGYIRWKLAKEAEKNKTQGRPRRTFTPAPVPAAFPEAAPATRPLREAEAPDKAGQGGALPGPGSLAPPSREQAAPERTHFDDMGGFTDNASWREQADKERESALLVSRNARRAAVIPNLSRESLVQAVVTREILTRPARGRRRRAF